MEDGAWLAVDSLSLCLEFRDAATSSKIRKLSLSHNEL